MDYCLASLKSLVQVFDGMSLIKYINWMLQICNNLMAKQADHISILCCSNFMEMASRNIKSVSTNDYQRSFNATIIARIVNATTCAETDGYLQVYLIPHFEILDSGSAYIF